MILICVDDILIMGNNNSHIQQCIFHLQNAFSLKDLSSLSYFLGIEVQSTKHGIHLTQTKYLQDLLTRTNMHIVKPSPTPMTANSQLSKEDSDLFDNPRQYRSIVSAFQYATITCPNISFAVNKVSQFMHAPTTNNWSAVKRILRYICGTINIYSDSSHDLHAYSDTVGPARLTIAAQHQDFASILLETLSLGVLKSNQLSPALALKLSTAVLPSHALNYFGSSICFKNSTFSFPLLLHYGVTILAQVSLPQIPCFMLAQNMWRSTTTSSANE